MPTLLANPALLGAAVSGVSSLIQGIGGLATAGKRQRAEAELEAQVKGMKVPEPIQDIYNKALARYSDNPYMSRLYNEQMRNVLANQAAGISALQSRRSALAGLPSIVQASNVGAQRAVGAAEAEQGQRFRELSGAAGTLAQQQRLKEQALINLKAQEASALAGTQNIQTQGALKSLGNMFTLGMYGLGKGETTDTGLGLGGGSEYNKDFFKKRSTFPV